MLAGNGECTSIIYNELSNHFNFDNIIIEEKISRIVFLKKRIRRLGLCTVFGQILFKLCVEPILKKLSKNRIKEILDTNQLSPSSEYKKTDKYIRIKNVNDDETYHLLKRIQPDIVVVNGTNIISKKILEATSAIFINMHAGITPKYRGCVGGYWALYNHDINNCGVTVHLVDPGIDTGDILYQAKIEPNKSDNYATYPFLQLAAGLPFMVNAVNDVIHHRLKAYSNSLPSSLYHHPTLYQYLITGLLFNRVK